MEKQSYDTPAVTVTARKDGFRRCGVAHSAEPTPYGAGHWSPEHLKALREEPMLIVQEAGETVQEDSGETQALQSEVASLRSENKSLKSEIKDLKAQLEEAQKSSKKGGK